MINLIKLGKWVTRRSKFISTVYNVREKLKVRIRLVIDNMCLGIAVRQREREREIERDRQTDRERLRTSAPLIKACT
jgi:hypothetical protein